MKLKASTPVPATKQCFDPFVLGPPESGSVIIYRDPDPNPSIGKQKKLQNNSALCRFVTSQ